MADKSKFSPEMISYFDSLPKYVQETIVQSKENITTIEELESIARNIVEL